MQLKRDTEFAIQIMVYIAENMEKNPERSGVPTGNVLAETNIPRVSFQRICGYLEENRLIRKEMDAAGETWLYPGENFWDQSLLSIAEAVEGNMQVFIIFSRKTHLIRKYGTVFKGIQENISDSFSKITMESLINQNG